jgi:hypothetical protein
MYLEINEATGKKWTLMELGEFFAVGETTIYRAVRGAGAYRNLPEPRTDEQLRIDSAKSLEKLLELTKDLREKEGRGDRLVEELEAEPGLTSAERLEKLAEGLRKGEGRREVNQEGE